MKIYKVIWREIGFYKTDVKANSKAEAEEKIRDNLGDASHINTNYCTKIDGITVVKENIKMKTKQITKAITEYINKWCDNEDLQDKKLCYECKITHTPMERLFKVVFDEDMIKLNTDGKIYDAFYDHSSEEIFKLDKFLQKKFKNEDLYFEHEGMGTLCLCNA